MKRYKDQYNIILLDWAPLSLYKEAAKFSLKFLNHYLDASRNAIDVGNFVGRCLSGLSRYWLPMTQLLLLGKFEYTGGPIFKVVLEC